LKSQMAANREEWIAVDLFFWVLVICLLVFGSSHYIWYPRVN
jgi:hypothetical protein